MEFDVENADESTAVIHVTGRLNMVAAPRLRQLVSATVGGGRTMLIVDLGGTEFIDSSGLGALIAGLKTARAAGGDLRIARPTPQVVTVLELTNLHRVLRPYASVAECLA